MAHKFFISFILIFLIQFGNAQENDSLQIKNPEYPLVEVNDSVKITSYGYDNVLGVVLGYSLGKYSYGEVGVSLNSSHHLLSFVKFIGTEFRIGQDFIVGPKVGFWFSGGIAFGLNAIYYTDFDDGALVFRPEIGFGLFGLKLVYGYNWNLTNKDFRGINSHFGGITFSFPVKKPQRLKELEIKYSRQ
ncbi:MAG: hypothetical protein WCY25_02530 [Moheibacter sp.]